MASRFAVDPVSARSRAPLFNSGSTQNSSKEMLRSWDNMPKGVPLLPSPIPPASSCLFSYTPEAKGEKNFWKLSFSEKASALQHMEDVKRTRVLFVRGRCLDSLPSANSHPHKQRKPPRMVCCHLLWPLSPLTQELLLTINCCYSPWSQTFPLISVFLVEESRLKRKSRPPHYSGHTVSCFMACPLMSDGLHYHPPFMSRPQHILGALLWWESKNVSFCAIISIFVCEPTAIVSVL